MLHFWLGPALLLNVVFATLIGVNHLQPYVNPPLETFFGTLAGCDSVCWSGIQPGQTTLGDLRIMLNQHHWVGGQDFLATVMPDTGAMAWTWDLPSGVPIDAFRRGIAGVDSGIVTYIQLPTQLTYGEIWLARGQPYGGQTLVLGNESFPDSLRHFSAYNSGGTLRIHIVVRCPFSRLALWEAPVDVWLGIKTDISLAAYTLPSAAECARS